MNRTLRRSASFCCGAIAVLLALGPTGDAAAQSASSQVLELNRRAMSAYSNLELEEAQANLERALHVARQRSVTGAPLARTYVNLGVITIGGFGDNARGLQYFVQALEVDPTIQLDPLTSTPEIEALFALARQQVGSGAGRGGGGGGAGATVPTGGGVEGTLRHTPIPEQLAQTAVPVYIEIPDRPRHVHLYYRGHGMSEFRRVDMQPVGNGFGYEIPCTDVFEPSVAYYIVAFARDGTPMGYAGTQNTPYTVPIVSSRTHPPPALPGRAPPETCDDEECPPGIPSCSSGRGRPLGTDCRADEQCDAELVCRDNRCVAAEPSNDVQAGDDDITHFFVRASLGGAFGYVQSGMLADDVPPGREGRPFVEHDPSAWISPGQGDCPEGGGYCVRVDQPGFVPNFQIRLAAGYYIHGAEWLGIAAFVRIAPLSGTGDLSSLVLGGRLQLRPLVDLERQGGSIVPLLTIFAGFSGGQVQHQPPANGPNAPWVISGLNGVPVGVSGGVRFGKNIGAYAEAEMMFQFPTFMFNLDLSAGVEVAF
jgi:hypothetical protein